jgi:hypothetical protein
MKKFFSILLINIVFIASLPLSNVFAYTGGLLDGKTFQFGADHLTSIGTTSNITDGNFTTGYDFSAHISANDTVWYEFSSTVDIRSFQIKGATTATALKVDLYNGAGTLISTYGQTDISGYQLNIPVAMGVKKVSITNISSGVRTAYEFDVFETESPIKELTYLTDFTGQYYNSNGTTSTRVTDEAFDNSQSTHVAVSLNNYLEFTFIEPQSLSRIHYFTDTIGNYEFFDEFGVKIGPTIASLTGANKVLELSLISDVKMVRFKSTGTMWLKNMEFYKNPPVIAHNPVENLIKTYTHDSVALSWENPIEPEFTGSIIKMNGVEVADLTTSITSHSINGLVAETSYDFEVIAKYSDGIMATAKTVSISTNAMPINITGTTNVNVNPGSLLINSFPAILEFNDYIIGTSNAVLNLKNPFKISIEDFSGSYTGWNLTMTIGDLTYGSDSLISPALNSNFGAVVINDADNTGLESLIDVSAPGTFVKADGTIIIGSAKKILSAQTTNPDAVARHYFNFPADSLELSFDNSIKAGFYTGVTTLTLVASP